MIKIPSFIFPKRLLYALPLFLAVSGLAQITVTQPVPAKVTVDVDAAQVASYRIPRTIYGSFLEPIGNST